MTRQRDYDAAVSLYQEAVRLNPRSAGFHINLAIVYHLLGRKDDALQAYDRAVQLESGYQGQFEIFER